MSIRNYWSDIFSKENWQDFLDDGSRITGFSANRWSTVQKIEPGDYLLCYLKKFSLLIGCLEVTSDPFPDNRPIWREAVFPSRVPVKAIVELSLNAAIPIKTLQGQLSIFKPENPNAWIGFFRQAPRKLRNSDAEIIMDALLKAQSNSAL